MDLYPEDRVNTQAIYRFPLAQVDSVHINVLLTMINKHFMSLSLSLLAGRTINYVF